MIIWHCLIFFNLFSYNQPGQQLPLEYCTIGKKFQLHIHLFSTQHNPHKQDKSFLVILSDEQSDLGSIKTYVQHYFKLWNWSFFERERKKDGWMLKGPSLKFSGLHIGWNAECTLHTKSRQLQLHKLNESTRYYASIAMFLPSWQVNCN